MPPTPFQPSHQTPFKSTISTSQQAKIHHTPFEGESSTDISISEIDPSEWSYHAEGGKNVLLSYNPSHNDQTPFRTSTYIFALRIPKSLPSSESQTVDEDEEEASSFTPDIITPLLGSPSVLPRCITIPITTPRDRDVIEKLAARIELARPASRRAHPARIRAEQLNCIYAVEDVTAPTSATASEGVLCVEIKPKWGFLSRVEALPPSSPNVEIKAKYSRFRMHKILKEGQGMTKERFEKLYDPLDLYSEDSERKERAIRALWADWKETNGKTNNLRLFWNGNVVSLDDAESLKSIGGFLSAQDGEESLLEALTQHLVNELSKPALPSNDGGEGKKMSVLSKLAQLQSSFDPLDVETLSQRWLELTESHTLGQLPPNSTQALPVTLTSALPTSSLLPLLKTFLQPSPSVDDLKLEDALQAFLVSASFKDCSLLIRFSRHSEEGEKVVLMGETKLVDLDRKAWGKLESMQKTDMEVCAAFLDWLVTLGEAPNASIAP